MKCVNCGEEATKGSLTHPYCENCWNKLWKGKEKQYEEWLLVHDTIQGMLWYKENILKQKLNLYDRFVLFFVGNPR